MHKKKSYVLFNAACNIDKREKLVIHSRAEIPQDLNERVSAWLVIASYGNPWDWNPMSVTFLF